MSSSAPICLSRLDVRNKIVHVADHSVTRRAHQTHGQMDRTVPDRKRT